MKDPPLSRADLGAVLVALAALGGIVPVLARPCVPPAEDPRLALNESRLRLIHEAMVLFAEQNKGRYPTPGLINRLPDEYQQANLPGIGPEDVTRNTTANLYASMIAQNYYEPVTVISPFERNPRVSEDKDYDYNAYDPAKDVYWDESFVADLARGSNASYAHLPITGQAKRIAWSRSAEPDTCVLGSRGPASGIASPQSLSCQADGTWHGALVFADGRVERVLGAAAAPVRSARLGTKDNPFALFDLADDPGHGPQSNPLKDAIIAFTRTIKIERAELQHD